MAGGDDDAQRSTNDTQQHTLLCLYHTRLLDLIDFDDEHVESAGGCGGKPASQSHALMAGVIKSRRFYAEHMMQSGLEFDSD